MSIEQEYKFSIEEENSIEVNLRKMGARGGERVHELTVMFDNKQNQMLEKDSRLRVRTRTFKDGSSVAILSFKQPLSREGVKQEIEHEVSVDNVIALKMILKEIGYEPVSSYERYRTDYSLGKGSQKIQVSIDELPFGKFVEIEGNNIDQITNLASSLGFDPSNHIPNSYDGIYDQIERTLGRKSNPHIRFN